LNKGHSQGKEKSSVQISLAGNGYPRPLLSALQPQFPLVLPFVQVAKVGRELRAGERLPDSFVARDLSPICRQGEIRIRTKKRRDLLRVGFIDPNLPGP